MAVKSAKFSASASLQGEREILNNLHGCPFVLECFGEETTTSGNGVMVYNLLIEYASGGTLGDVIFKTNGRGLPEHDVRHFTWCILEGLSYIHGSGYVHCDLKPDNILLVPTEDGKSVAKIGDLGSAKRARQRCDHGWKGTPLYMAPETVVSHSQEPPSDVWALGCVVLEMLTGRQAWDMKQDCSLNQLLHRIGNEHSVPEIPDWISEGAKDFLSKCFVRKPMLRFTAEMLLDTPFVQGYLNGEIFQELKGEWCSDGELSLPETVSESRSSSLSSEDENNRSSFSSVEEVASGIQRRNNSNRNGQSTVTVDM